MNKLVYFHHSQPDLGMELRKHIVQRITVAGVVTGERMNFGISRCSSSEQFSRAKGRKIAEGRARKKPCHTINLLVDIPNGKQFIKVATDLLKYDNANTLIK